VVFDVGANVGKFTTLLADVLNCATIYAFEPNKNAFETLQRLEGENTHCFNLGLGASRKQAQIYTYGRSLDSSHASIYPGVFKDFYKHDDVASIDFHMETLDDFCRERAIDYIDFIKIDTEGNELNVLLGAQHLLSEGRISSLQFEFGECHVFSRVFLRDFYDILGGYNIYRLDSERLLPLHDYNVRNEIFRYQNLFAVKKELDFLQAETSVG
jgi:FkbM family methyltransferase